MAVKHFCRVFAEKEKNSYFLHVHFLVHAQKNKFYNINLKDCAI